MEHVRTSLTETSGRAHDSEEAAHHNTHEAGHDNTYR